MTMKYGTSISAGSRSVVVACLARRAHTPERALPAGCTARMYQSTGCTAVDV